MTYAASNATPFILPPLITSRVRQNPGQHNPSSRITKEVKVALMSYFGGGKEYADSEKKNPIRALMISFGDNEFGHLFIFLEDFIFVAWGNSSVESEWPGIELT